jgi:hypothetical protein
MKFFRVLPILSVILLTRCNNNSCEIDYIHFERYRAPLIYIIEPKDACVYRFEGQFWFEKHSVISEGELIFDNDAICLVIDGINSSKIKYFDFSKKIGEVYQIAFDQHNSSLTAPTVFSAAIDQILTNNDGINVFIFRMKGAFIHREEGPEYRADLVYFATRENGIMGSYISSEEGDVEMVIHRRGNILEDVIDYTKKEFRNIE